MAYPLDHPSNFGSIRQDEGLMEPPESETFEGLFLVTVLPDATLRPFHVNRLSHENLSGVLPSLLSLVHHLFRHLQLADAVQHGFDQVVGVRGPEAFG